MEDGRQILVEFLETFHYHHIKTYLFTGLLVPYHEILSPQFLCTEQIVTFINRARGPYEEIFVLTVKAYDMCVERQNNIRVWTELQANKS